VNITTIQKENIKHVVKSIVSYGLEQGYSIALWRLPNQTTINLLLATESKTVTDLSIEDSQPGFVFAPFNPEVPKYFLAGDHHFEINDETINEITPGQVKEMTLKSSLNTKLKFYSGTYNSANIDNQDYEELVKLSLNAVEAGTFEKVVPSMQRRIDINSDFDLLHAFDELNNKYPMAMVSLLSDSTIGTWLGASPELLVSTDKNGIFKTIALAGTQVYNENIPLRNISWTQKEIEEQALVERYIISCFKKIRVREYDEHGPKSVQAGNLIHLKSDFEVDMKAVNYPQLGSVMLKLLHPTSAVCGMPMEPSLKFLQENEAHEREFYAGFLGPVNIDQESHLYVNLRCLKWKGDHILLYAGAGVTIDSLPQQEVEEVEIKMETIKKALGL
jgi:isochorismate synthase